MNAIILSIGDELVLGQTVDTNSPWLSQQLAQIGIAVVAHLTVGDDQKAIEQAIRDSAKRSDLLLITGGIGPTPDDLTRQALAAVMNQPLELREDWLAELHRFFAARGRPMPDINRIQAMIPRGAELIWNHNGTAAGISAVVYQALVAGAGEYQGRPIGRVLVKMGRITRDQLVEALSVQKQHKPMTYLGEILIRLGYATDMDITIALAAQKGKLPEVLTGGNECRVFVMPGVPKEMKLMFERPILPELKDKSSGGVILSKTLHTFGQGESTIAELLGPLMDRSRNPTVGTTVSGGIVSIRINSRFPTKDGAQRHLADTAQSGYAALGHLIFGEDDTTLAEAVAALLKSAGKAVATAESCTGGLLAKYLTDIPGSSAYFKQGWITYSNEAKTSLLNVAAEQIAQYGAVSEPVVRNMAARAAAKSGADYALAISGIAGPDGGTPAKPVGTVCIALATARREPGFTDVTDLSARTFLFPGDREMIRDRSAKMALTMLRFHLLGKPLPF